MGKNSEIVIRPAGPDAPGFLRRWKRSMALQQRINRGDSEALDEMINLLIESAEEIIVPDGVDPKDAIMDLSRNEFDALISAVNGTDSAVDPQNGD